MGGGWGGGRTSEAHAGRDSSGAALLPRHRRALVRALTRLRAARSQVRADARTVARPEVVAATLREGLDWLGELTGRMDPDAIIGRVFAAFCIGK